MRETERVLGRKEDLHLEFKRWEVDDEKIAREVVGMLNADGGEIWVGVEDSGGGAVAIQNPARVEERRTSLQDLLLDRVVPAPRGLHLEAVELAGRRILRITVPGPPAGGRPFAMRKGPYWGFFLRIGDRLVPMGVEDLARRLGEAHVGPGADPWTVVGDELDRSFEELLEELNGSDVFRIVAVPVTDPAEPVFDRRSLQQVFENPERVGSKPGRFHCLPTWSWAPPGLRPRPFRSGGSVVGIEFGMSDAPRNHLRAWFKGRLEFRTGIVNTMLRERSDRGVPLLEAAALVSFVVSFFRVLTEVLRDCADPPPYLAIVEFANTKEVQLRPLLWRDALVSAEYDDEGIVSGPHIRPLPVRIETGDLADSPDRVARRLLSEVYVAFGYEENVMPYWEGEPGRFVLP